MRSFRLRKSGHENFTYVAVKVYNPHSLNKSRKLNFLVDTGAAICALPKEIATELGIEERGLAEIGLADGRSTEASLGFALLEVGGHRIYTWVIIGEGFEPILGADIMNMLSIHVDVQDRQALIPIKHFTIKRIVVYP